MKTDEFIIMKYLLIVFMICPFWALQAQKTVHLKGKLVDLGSESVELRYDGAAGEITNDGSFMIRTDTGGNFDTVLPLEKPGFYRISRNTLYLTPGDDMDVYIARSKMDAFFKGKGAEANTYMKGRLFPKGGSFLGELYQIKKKGEFPEIKAIVDSLALIRMAELDRVQSVSAEFKALEKARIVADVINSYLYYPYYCAVTPMNTDEAYDAFVSSIVPDLLPLYQQINNERYLDVAVVRSVIFQAMGVDGLKEKIEFPVRAYELSASAKYAYKLNKDGNYQIIGEVCEYMKTLKNKDFREALAVKIQDVEVLKQGNPAIDLELVAPDGKKVHLSDYKGKLIYVDLWATWCGPCIAESPKFHELATKYKDDNIVFLAVSKDSNKQAWLTYLEKKESVIPEYNCTDTEVLENGWQVKYIPRFLLIDEDFRIIDAYAPLPSQPEAEKMLDKLLKK